MVLGLAVLSVLVEPESVIAFAGVLEVVSVTVLSESLVTSVEGVIAVVSVSVDAVLASAAGVTSLEVVSEAGSTAVPLALLAVVGAVLAVSNALASSTAGVAELDVSATVLLFPAVVSATDVPELVTDKIGR